MPAPTFSALKLKKIGSSSACQGAPAKHECQKHSISKVKRDACRAGPHEPQHHHARNHMDTPCQLMVFAARLAVAALNHASRLTLAVARKDGKPVPGVAVARLTTNKSALSKASLPNETAVTQGKKKFIPAVFTGGRRHQDQVGQQRPRRPLHTKLRLRTWIRSTPPGMALK